MITTFRIKHSHGLEEGGFDSMDAALASLATVYGDNIVWDGDPDSGDSVLVWRDDASSLDDDGLRACARIFPCFRDEP